MTAEHLTHALDLRPNPLWQEALKVSRLRTLPDNQPLVDPEVWRSTMTAFTNGPADDQAIWRAASQLFLDGALYTLGFHQPDAAWLREMGYTDDMIAAHRVAAAETQALLAALVGQTRDRPEPALRIAHCIRDLAYGDESRGEDLKAMVESDDPEYHRIFVDCYWLPTEEERVREEEEDRRREREVPRSREGKPRD